MLPPHLECTPFALIADPDGHPELERALSGSSLACYRVGDARLPDPHAARVVLGSPEAVQPWLGSARGPVGVVVGESSAPDSWLPGVEYWLRSPVDGPALRLLLWHLLSDRAADRRMARRVDVQLEVRVRAGLWSRPAVLCELSATGARVGLARPLRPGSRVEVRLPPGASGARPCRLTARVLRTVQDDGWRSALAFTHVPLAAQERIRLLVRAASSWDPVAGPDPARVDPHQRRSASRRRYTRRVIARGRGRPRVLLGCDLSAHGMRVEPARQLSEGDSLEIALHVRRGEVPLVLRARVDRDDGERGLFLRFEGVGDDERKFLAAMLSDLPAIEGQRGSLVVSQVLRAD